ncbi:MAG: hypothetical protein JWS12_624 [Candidatus Saccharibacteria bacterium]|nr:hypothetical protein [Candidatus Saccharibacteria bacterium]
MTRFLLLMLMLLFIIRVLAAFFNFLDGQFTSVMLQFAGSN